MLNTKKAFELWGLIGKYIPDELPEDMYGFIGTIVENIKNGDHTVYTKSILLMNDNITLSELLEMDIDEIMGLFIQGLMKNKILKLQSFFKGMENGR